MKVIIKPRRGGKTFELVKMAAETGAVIICQDTKEVTQIIETSKKFNLVIKPPITILRVMATAGQLTPGPGQGFLIDDADEFIRNFFKGFRIDAISLTSETPEEWK